MISFAEKLPFLAGFTGASLLPHRVFLSEQSHHQIITPQNVYNTPLKGPRRKACDISKIKGLPLCVLCVLAY